MNTPLDPTKVKTQLNLQITYDLMDRLDRLSAKTHKSKSELVRTAIEKTYFADHFRDLTRDAGATR